MHKLAELKSVAKELAEFAQKHGNVSQAEGYAASNSLNIYRIVYHSKIKSNGVEEAKGEEGFGLSLRVLFKDGKYGFGSADNDFSRDGFKEAFAKANDSKVLDTDFHSLPEKRKGKVAKAELDEKIAKLDENKTVEKAWHILYGAFDLLGKNNYNGINLTGELDTFSNSFAVESTNGPCAAEQNAGCIGTLTANLESADIATGTSFESSPFLSKLNAKKVGTNAIHKAMLAKKTQAMPTGKYPVILSEGVVAELFYSRFDTAVSSVDVNASPFIGKIGEKLGNDELTVTDDPHLKGAIGSKAFNDEGAPTEKITLIENGVLKNLLSNDYYSKKKKEYSQFPARNGFRGGGTRNHNADVGIAGTNIVVGAGNHKDEELFEQVKDGIYVGRIWYTYPVNGYSSFDYSSTIRGDSFVIKNGEIVAALAPNSMRILDSFSNFLQGIRGIGKKQKAVQSWGQDEIIVTPKISLAEMNMKRISNGN